MSVRMPRWLVPVCGLLLAGCVNQQHTRLPRLGFGDPQAEKATYNYHDPLVDQDAGPFVERPRGFDVQRTEPRRAMEHRVNPAGYNDDPAAAGLPPSAAKYPNTVSP